MGKKMTRVDWKDIKSWLMLVPPRARTEAWGKLMSLAELVLAQTSDIAREYSPETLRFSVNCDLCKRSISIQDNYVAYADGRTRHYDCHQVHVDTEHI